jgi:hypothetical protein
LRQAKGRPQAAQVFCGRSAFFTIFGIGCLGTRAGGVAAQMGRARAASRAQAMGTGRHGRSRGGAGRAMQGQW